jgi:hypothetical protein
MLDLVFKVFIFFVVTGMLGLTSVYFFRFIDKTIDGFNIPYEVTDIIRKISLGLVQIGFLGTALIFVIALF